MSYCESCDRGFVSEAALERHIRDSSRHAYCTRCERPFGSLESLQQHVRNSSSHHICSDCSIEDDFPTSADLEKHRETVHHLCSRCNRRFDTAGQLSQHNISRHNMCIVCRTCIDSQHNLRAVGVKFPNADVQGLTMPSTFGHTKPRTQYASDAPRNSHRPQQWSCTLNKALANHGLIKIALLTLLWSVISLITTNVRIRNTFSNVQRVRAGSWP